MFKLSAPWLVIILCLMAAIFLYAALTIPPPDLGL